MRVLLAFDKFKDNMTARQACEAAAGALREVYPGWEILQVPLTDGGEGFCEILTLAAGGELHARTVMGPLGEPVSAHFGLIDTSNLSDAARAFLDLPDAGTLAVIEMAQAAGLEQVPQRRRNPWHTTTRGVGELIHEAVVQGVSGIVMGIGGSATNDLGAGMLAALGIELLDEAGEAVADVTPANWSRIQSIDMSSMRSLPLVRIACDVTNPLLGERGASAVYGPQKGMPAGDLETFEAEQRRMAELLTSSASSDGSLTDEPGSGAAGGIGFGLRAVHTGARYVAGFELVQRWLQLEEKLAAADVVITGEGRFDRSSIEGKGPGTLINSAVELGKSVHVLAGMVSEEALAHLPTGMAAGRVRSIEPPGMPLEEALRNGPANLHNTILALFSAEDSP